MSDNRLTVGFLSLVAVSSGAYLVTQDRLIWVAIGLASAAMIGLGVHRHRPRPRAPWLAIMAALLALTAGDAAHFLVAEVSGSYPSPSVADVTYLVVFLPLIIIGIGGLARASPRAARRTALLDVLIVTAALAWLSWLFLIHPVIADPGHTPLQKALIVAYPATSVFLVACLIRLGAAVRRAPAVALPALGTLGMLAVEAMLGWGQVRGDWLADGPAALGWFALYAGWAAGALHPSMARLTRPWTEQRPDLTRRRLMAVILVAMIPPVVLVLESGGLPVEDAVRRGLTLALFLLVLVRLYTVVDRQRRSLARERALRSAGAALVSATTVTEVTEVVEQAVNRLLPHGVRREVALELDPRATASVAGSRHALPGPATAAGASPAGASPAAASPAGAPPAGGSVHRLTAPPASRPDTPEAVLRCPVRLRDGRGGDHDVGVLSVAAPEEALICLRAAVEVLASQAALALDRIRLTVQINQHASEQHFRALVQNAADMIFIVDGHGDISYASPSATAVLDGDHPTRLHDLVAPEDRPVVDRALARLGRDRANGISAAECTVLAARGRRLRTEVSCCDLRHDPTVGGVVVTLHDVTEQHRLQGELTFLAFHDALTGLANRALFHERLDRALVRAAHRDRLVGVLFVDLDNLKDVNDTLGHAAGDELLIAAAHRLSGALGRQQDAAARLGGDEFAALLEGLDGPEAADRVAEQVSAAFREPFHLGHRSVTAGASVGVATATPGMAGEDLLRQADAALYEAKSAGKAQWRRFTPVRDPGSRQDGHGAGSAPGAVAPGAVESEAVESGAVESEPRLPRPVVRRSWPGRDPAEIRGR